MGNDFDAIIIGSGAGGGPVAFQLASAGKKIAIIEAGGFYTTNDFDRFELLALRKLWWKPRWTSNYEQGLDGEIALGMGRCVGGSTTIFTAVAHRAPEFNFAEWNKETGLENDKGEPFSLKDLDPYYSRVERDTGVRRYTEWDDGLKLIDKGFQKIGHPFKPVNAFINEKCDHSGCLFGCPTEAKRGTMVTYIIPAILSGAEMFYNSTVTRILFSSEKRERPSANGVEFVNDRGEKKRLTAKIIILSSGALNTPLLLLDSGIEEIAEDSPSVSQIGRNFGVNTAVTVFGKFDQPIDNWIMHPLSGQMEEFSQKEKGGFLLEASEVMEGPLAFSELIVDEDEIPLWGEKQKKIVKDYRYYAGVFINIHDANDGRIFRDKETGQEKYYKPVTAADRSRFRAAKSMCREAFDAAGANETVDSVYLSHHVQGSCRMGKYPEKSAVDTNCKLRGVDGLYVMDGSVIPSVIDANPSLTIMALSRRLGEHLLRSVLN